jgi:hypothetical protein
MIWSHMVARYPQQSHFQQLYMLQSGDPFVNCGLAESCMINQGCQRGKMPIKNYYRISPAVFHTNPFFFDCEIELFGASFGFPFLMVNSTFWSIFDGF